MSPPKPKPALNSDRQMPREASSWFILKVTPRAEDKARIALRRLGLGVYIPKMKIERQHRRTKKWATTEHQLLPGYMFVEFTFDERPNGRPRFDDWKALRSCDGVKEVMGIQGDDDSQPYAIPTRIVERLMRQQEEMVFDDTRAAKLRRREIGKNERETTTMRFPVGTQVRAKDGPFASFMGLVTNITAKGEIEALFSLFGRLAPVTFPVEHLETVAEISEAA